MSDSTPLIDVLDMQQKITELREDLIAQRMINNVLLGMLDQTQKDLLMERERNKKLEERLLRLPLR